MINYDVIEKEKEIQNIVPKYYVALYFLLVTGS